MTPQEFFKNDRFAEGAGVKLLEIREGYGKASLTITEEHLNAGGRTQGGAIFTLADLALAAAANSHGALAFSLSSSITFLRGSGPGDVLYAEAHERYIGRTTGYYQIDVTNQDGKLIATFESSVFRKGDPLPFGLTSSALSNSSDSDCP
ncbi:PaaI family thioesterase [Bacteroides sp. UBA939]|uniref:PaaI family thioesterase n=1 Tax=Bacteroides sp. UBA939 TaxID=1946092 RepID=UPI0025C089A9|nr:hotdog fold thioesterase [Bacteroides sp. UBA939]